MISPTGSRTPSRNRQKVNLIFTILVLVSMACSLPGLGKVKAHRLMEKLGIAESRRLRGLGARQREALIDALS